MMTHGYDRPLYVLPFDHRGSSRWPRRSRPELTASTSM